MILELVRLEESEQGTFGILKIDKQVFCCTLEPSDRLNEVNRSSIPAQQYTLKPYDSPTHGETWMVTGVPGRSYILFHAGNVVEHTAGCIILGEHFGNRAVLNSGKTFADFLKVLHGAKEHHLTVQEHY